MSHLLQKGLALRELLRERVLILDGAMGTVLQQANLSETDFGGPHLEGCNENLVFTRPDVVLSIHRKYLEAGSDKIETNSFGSAPIVLGEYGLADRAPEMNRRAAELARQAAEWNFPAARPRRIARRPGRYLDASAPGRDRGAPHRRDDDGPRSERERTRLSSS
jgi:5-methyltetrahydrofolate--homocysteine methyltransferase